MESYTEGIPCFVIGLGYRNGGTLQISGDMIDSEIKSFQTIRDVLIQKYPIDPNRVFVAGFSKGGWVSAFVIESDAKVAGAAVLGAGALDAMPILDEHAARGKPVYIGVGIEDKNQINSARLEERMKKLGASPSLDQWDETGHSFPKGDGGAIGLRQWLQLQLAPESIDDTQVRTWASERLQDIRAMEDDGQKYLALIRFKSRPFLQQLGRQGQAIVEKEIADIRQTEKGNREAQAWERFERLVEQELKDRSATALRRYAEQYDEITKLYPETISQKYAQSASQRINQVLGQ